MRDRGAGWREEQAERRAAAEAALDGGLPLAELLSAWPLPLTEARAASLLGALDPPQTEDLSQLVAWAAGEDPDGAAPPPAHTTPRERQISALTLLSRLGEDYRRREHEAPQARAWRAADSDETLRRCWLELLRGPPDPSVAEPLRKRFMPVVKASFLGVATVLRLPSELGQDLSRRALEQLDLVLPICRAELAAWVVETAGEPVGALEAALGPRPWERVRAAVASRPLWAEVSGVLGLEATLSEGVAGVVLRRLCLGLSEGRATPHELGSPGWGVVAANRARIRGRLRVVAAMDLAALAGAVGRLDALTARTADSLGRFSWAWAWREARAGFGLGLDRAGAPPCVIEPPSQEPLCPLGEAEQPALITLLLLVAGRGCWDDLERWVDGESGRDLGRGLYRCLGAAPESLVDPDTLDRRSRRYERLRAWLFDGGLEASQPTLALASARVAGTRIGRTLRAELREALSPWWDERAISFPQHHLPGFREGLLDPRFTSTRQRTPPGSRR